MKLFWLILLIILCAMASCQKVRSEVITEKFLDAVAQVESSGRATVIGDGGKARGMFQLHRAAWEDAAKIDPSLGDYKTGSLNPATARRAARIYLTLLSRQLQKAGQPPTASVVYLCYNRGFSGAASISFDVSKAPKHTQLAIQKLNTLMK